MGLRPDRPANRPCLEGLVFARLTRRPGSPIWDGTTVAGQRRDLTGLRWVLRQGDTLHARAYAPKAMTILAFPGHAGRSLPLLGWRLVARIGDMVDQ